jgi:hypothetical protein
MTADASGALIGFLLRRVGVVAGVLAVIAGIFGMHIMTGSHSMPAATSTGAVQVGQAASGHSDHAPGRASVPDTPAVHGMEALPDQSCHSGSCTSMHTMWTLCVPSPGTTSLTAPVSVGTTTLTVHQIDNAAAVESALSYIPKSPSPGDLCISRT